jgi:hypothetical protein
MKYECWLCKGRTTTNQKQPTMNQRHQNLVQMNKDQVARRASQRAAVQASTNKTLIMDGVSDLLEPVIGMNEGQPD